MTRICMIRHGETEWNRLEKLQGRLDIELNETGILQAKKVGEYLKDKEWDVIVSSPLLRAYKTAKYISKILSLSTIVLRDDLVERDYGKASGLTKSERERLYPDRIYPNVESEEDVEKRMMSCVLMLAEEYKGKNILVVSHGSAISTLLKKVSNHQLIERLHNCSINTLTYENERLEIEKYNESIV